MFKSCDTIVYIIINLGLLSTYAVGHNDSNIHHPGGFPTRASAPLCGIKPRPAVSGYNMVIQDFAWHAIIYATSTNSTEKKFICGSTIITENLLITAAHCVFNEVTKKPDNPDKFLIVTGSLFSDYDYDYYYFPVAKEIIKRVKVKNIYINCEYRGLDGNYDRDIAILQIEPSINFTASTLPICLDTNMKRLNISVGRSGDVTGFSRNRNLVYRPLEDIPVPVMPQDICLNKSEDANFRKFVTGDKFCTGYQSGIQNFSGDGGSGLVFKTNNTWYIRGIQSIGIGRDRPGCTNTTCDNDISALYTDVSFYMEWIRDIMFQVEQGKTIAECSEGFKNGVRSDINSRTTNHSGCSVSQFQCGTGQCIDGLSHCDGLTDCPDRSDETAAVCGANKCVFNEFRCTYGACLERKKKCDSVRDCADGSDEGRICRRIPATFQSVCPPPPEIQHGYWKLHSSQCPSNNDHCNPPEGMDMVSGTHLVYFCNYGYQLTDAGSVHCNFGGMWTDIPECKGTLCRVLDTSSTKADCSRNGGWTSCATPVLPGTQAEVSCRTSYRPDSVWQRKRVMCNSTGQWEPDPIKCIPVCGIKPPKDVKPFVVNGGTPVMTDFPWHATIYRTSKNNTEKTFICGATIITENLLITAAHCVFDEGIKKPENPRKFVIATGNFFSDYDYEYPSPIVVRKAQVKNIYMNCDYQGMDGNYDRDIAILHIEPSINFTSYSMPICLDTNPANRAIDLGANGAVAGFGRTAGGSVSSILQSLSVPVVPKTVCIRESKEVNFHRFVTADKFCAGYRNGSSVCDGDSGGGLIFETNNLWYIRGIVSSGLGMITTGGTRTCDNTQYTIYTEISSHILWIQEIMLKVEQFQTIPECSTRNKRHESDFNQRSILNGPTDC